MALLAFAALGVMLFLLPSGEALSQRIQQVFVTNLPDVWKVEGGVEIVKPVRLSQSQSFLDLVVAPVPPKETTRLVDAGVLATEGFPALVLSLHGVVKGDVQKPGTVGAILIPEEDTIREAFDEQGLMHFPLEVAATGVSSRTPYFTSDQPRYTVAFPSYRVFLYNTTDKTVNVNVFAYLTN
jgi:hypothetical protein